MRAVNTMGIFIFQESFFKSPYYWAGILSLDGNFLGSYIRSECPMILVEGAGRPSVIAGGAKQSAAHIPTSPLLFVCCFLDCFGLRLAMTTHSDF